MSIELVPSRDAYVPYWADAMQLGSSLDPNSDVYESVRYLTHDVATRAIPADVVPFGSDKKFTLTPKNTFELPRNFFIVDREALSSENVGHQIMERVIEPKVLAFVFHSLNLTVMVLNEYNHKTPQGNASLFLHELMHVTEREEGLISDIPTPHDTASRERRAYGLNADIYRAFDGDKYDDYARTFPSKNRNNAQNTGVIAADESTDNPYRPPKGTFIDEVWQEGQESRYILLAAAWVTALEDANKNLTEAEINNLMAGMFTKSS